MADEFKSHTSYLDFTRSVMQWRYIRSPDDEDFLRHVASTAERRIEEIQRGTTLWRAQVGCNFLDTDVDGIEVALNADRMKPPPHWRSVGQSREGRTNPKGIPFLYTATNEHIAISEVKPSPGDFVTVAGVRTNKALRIVNVTSDGEKMSNIVYLKEPEGAERELAIWRDIDRAFSATVARSVDRADYASTQILAELFRKKGLDGIGYRSAFGTGHNIALFDPGAADVVSCQLHAVIGSEVRYSARGLARPDNPREQHRAGEMM
jgi:hypothetical protein